MWSGLAGKWNAPNTPNCPKRGTEAVSGGRDTPPFHYSIIPPFQSDANGAKQSQLPAGPARQAGSLERGNVQNEPNFRRRRKKSGEDAQPTKSRIVQNEPNFGQPGWHPAMDCAKRTQFGTAGAGPDVRKMQNEPNLPPERPPGPWPEPIVQNEPNSARRGRRQVPGARNMRNEPNSPAVGLAPEGKLRETNPISGGKDIPAIPVQCRLCETKPISSGLGPAPQEASEGVGRGHPTHSLWLRAGSTKSRIVQNEANSSIADFGLRIADWGQTSGGLPPQSRGGRNMQNEPNLAGRPGGWERPIVRNKANWAGRPGPRRQKCAKRTQFPAERIPRHSSPMAIVQNEANFRPCDETGHLFLLYSSSGGGYTWGFCVHLYVHGWS